METIRCKSLSFLYFPFVVSKEEWVMDVWDSSVERVVGIFVSLSLSTIGRWKLCNSSF